MIQIARTWTLSVDAPVGELSVMVAQATGYAGHSIMSGRWASVTVVGAEPPDWMRELADRFAADGIAHDLS